MGSPLCFTKVYTLYVPGGFFALGFFSWRINSQFVTLKGDLLSPRDFTLPPFFPPFRNDGSLGGVSGGGGLMDGCCWPADRRGHSQVSPGENPYQTPRHWWKLRYTKRPFCSWDIPITYPQKYRPEYEVLNNHWFPLHQALIKPSYPQGG